MNLYFVMARMPYIGDDFGKYVGIVFLPAIGG